MTCMPVESNSNLLGGVFSMLLGSVISESYVAILPTTLIWALTSLTDFLVVMGMMIYFVFTKHRNFNSALLTIFYRDGIFYFLAITGMAGPSSNDRAVPHALFC